jgi:hypothetical protein
MQVSRIAREVALHFAAIDCAPSRRHEARPLAQLQLPARIRVLAVSQEACRLRSRVCAPHGQRSLAAPLLGVTL